MYKGFNVKKDISIIDKIEEPTVFFWFSICLLVGPCVMASFAFLYIMDSSIFSFIADDEIIEYLPKFREDYNFLLEIYGPSYATFYNRYVTILSIIGFIFTLPLSAILAVQIALYGANMKYIKYNKYLIMLFIYIFALYFVYVYPTVYKNPGVSRGGGFPVNHFGMIALMFIYSSLNIAYVLLFAVIVKYIKYMLVGKNRGGTSG